MSEADTEKMVAARNGDEDALAELLEQFGPIVRRELQIAPKWQPVLDLDDVMQITYMEAYLRIRDFDEDKPALFLAWLRKIARNNLIDAVRGLERGKRPQPEQRLREPVADESYVALLDIVGVTTTTPSRIAAASEVRRMIQKGLKALPADYAEVIRLFDLEGLSGPEVGERMGRSRGAAFMLLARARQRLAEMLGSESQFFSRK
jgi:RNA polymerase sigma-70 factor (ECF subfamily)